MSTSETSTSAGATRVKEARAAAEAQALPRVEAAAAALAASNRGRLVANAALVYLRSAPGESGTCGRLLPSRLDDRTLLSKKPKVTGSKRGPICDQARSAGSKYRQVDQARIHLGQAVHGSCGPGGRGFESPRSPSQRPLFGRGNNPRLAF